MFEETAVVNLRRKRKRMIPAYIGFVCMFVSSGAMAGTGLEAAQVGILLVVMLALSLPVIALNISLHHAIKRVEPTAGSSGLKQAIISTALFTPFEAALVLPIINLTIAGAVLRRQDDGVRAIRNEPNH